MSCFDYKIGVPTPGTYQEVFNSDAVQFGGSGQVNDANHFSIPQKWHTLSQHIKIKVPPLASQFLNAKKYQNLLRRLINERIV